MSEDQKEMMQHALGLTRAKKSYRNYYCVDVGSDDERKLNELVETGYMEYGQFINRGTDRYYHVTQKGREFLGLLK